MPVLVGRSEKEATREGSKTRQSAIETKAGTGRGRIGRTRNCLSTWFYCLSFYCPPQAINILSYVENRQPFLIWFPFAEKKYRKSFLKRIDNVNTMSYIVSVRMRQTKHETKGQRKMSYSSLTRDELIASHVECLNSLRDVDVTYPNADEDVRQAIKTARSTRLARIGAEMDRRGINVVRLVYSAMCA